MQIYRNFLFIPAVGSFSFRQLARFYSGSWHIKCWFFIYSTTGPKGVTGLSINNILRTQRDQMETAFKYFEANEIFPTRAEYHK